MMNSNTRIKEGLANGTSCYGMYIQLKDGCGYKKENWNDYMVNTVCASDIEYIICRRENKKNVRHNEYFKVKPERSHVTATLKEFACTIPIKGIAIEQLPMNSNIATTCHKLQGKTLENLVINSWNYTTPNWVYVVLSRVTTLREIVLNKKLDKN